MSNPANPLDIFTSYTYHFELHAHKSWDVISLLENSDANGVTTSKEANGTLLINTRRDAHQTIDNVKFSYYGPSCNNHGMMTPSGDLSFEIIEPNGMHFIEKLANLFSDNQVTVPTALQWALKIFFVGRKPDNSIVTLPENGLLIPMKFDDMSSDFTYQGGRYLIKFSSMSSWGGQVSDPSPSEFANTLITGYCNKNIAISARTIKEAITELERKLNENYKKTYERELYNPGARSIEYKIKLDPSIDGELTTTQKRDFSPSSPCMFNFSPDQPILSWIYTILRSSKSLNEEIGASFDAITKPHHEGIKLLSVIPTMHLGESTVTLKYDVMYYTGGSDTLEFDYMFAEPGKNVDVMGFDIRMNSALTWFSSHSTQGVDHQANITSTMPADEPQKTAHDIIVKDQTTPKLLDNPECRTIPVMTGDIAFLPSSSKSEIAGHIRQRHDAVPAAKMMFDTIAKNNSAYAPDVNFTIRGHLTLLKSGIIYPNPMSRLPIGMQSPLWLKVNIKDPEGNPFFYTGKYNIISIENYFSGGKFTQNISTMMYDILVKDGATQ